MNPSLLTKVLNSITHESDIQIPDDILKETYVFRYLYKNVMCSIDMYRLVHFCKLYAIHLGYKIQSGNDGQWYCMIDRDDLDEHMLFDRDTEADAVFSACEFIRKRELENDESNN